MDGSGERRPTVITMTGMDGYQEETYFGVVAAALERGYNCLTYDGPARAACSSSERYPTGPTGKLWSPPP